MSNPAEGVRCRLQVLDKRQIMRRHITSAEQLGFYELAPMMPIGSARRIYEHDRNEATLTRLQQGQDFKSLV